MSATADKPIEERVKPILTDAMQKFLGVTVAEIGQDLTTKITRNPLIGISVDVSIPFKQAKRLFKKHYLAHVLQSSLGNIADAARTAGLNRRSIHRLVATLNINATELRDKPLEYFRQEAVQHLIQQTLQQYKSSLNPDRLEQLYKFAPELSKEILSELPEQQPSLAEAEAEFEREYFAKALALFGNNLAKTSRAIGLRYETLHRKLKAMGLKAKP